MRCPLPININLTNVHKYVINITYNIHKISIEFFHVIINFSGYSKYFSCVYSNRFENRR